MGAADGAVHLGLARLGHLGPGGAGGRIKAGEARRALFEFPVDVELEAVHARVLTGRRASRRR